ncbi:MAG: alpha/beta hydrolase [Actinomycetota bacterium]|nr:alpha/beta hydrolase [Actinomycetota bacterium]MDA8280260.1 alpha/beta hydrolase [Actinomycetota bacterium]
MSTRTVPVNGLELAYQEMGPPDGPLALCLHGFPDTASTWRHLMPQLADAGYHAVAPFLRGYAPSAVPTDGCYQTGALAADAVGLHQALGGTPDAVVIGHDWGAFAAYGAAGVAPGRWRRVVALSVPPLPVGASGFFTFDQLRRSFYVFFFQSPLADAVVATDDFAFIEQLWRLWSPAYDPAADMAGVRRSLAEEDRVRAALGYYRAMFGAGPRLPEHDAAQQAADGIPPQPTLYLHGTDDGCMGVELAAGVADALAPGSRVHVVEGAGHFLHLERPAEVNAAILDFLRP